MITQHPCAVLLNKDTFTRDFTYAYPRCLFAVKDMVVTGKIRRAPEQSVSYFAVASVHINNECAKRRAVSIALLLLIRDLCMKLGAVILTGDLNKAVVREAPAGGFGERRTTRSRLPPRQHPMAHVWRCTAWGPGGEPTVVSGLIVAFFWSF